MADKTLKMRLKNKIDTYENWGKAENFIPLEGELIVYKGVSETDLPRVKIGDGKTTVSSLKFIDEDLQDLVNDIVGGDSTVANASHATSADSATTATTAGSADKATQDAQGNVITETYETKIDSAAKLAEAKQYTDAEIAAKIGTAEDCVTSEDVEVIWTGTLEEYNAIETKDPTTLYHITDDYELDIKASNIENDMGWIANEPGAYDYENLANIPEYVLSDFTNDVGYITNRAGAFNYENLNHAPTALSEFTNDMDFVQNIKGGFSYDYLANKPTIATKTSQLTNDAGFLTEDVLEEQGYVTNTAGAYNYENLANKPTIVNVYVGSSDPAANLGNDGDIYIKVE